MRRKSFETYADPFYDEVDSVDFDEVLGPEEVYEDEFVDELDYATNLLASELEDDVDSEAHRSWGAYKQPKSYPGSEGDKYDKHHEYGEANAGENGSPERARYNKMYREEIMGKNAGRRARQEHARFEEGVPADPTVNMSEEEAREWQENTDKYKDKFKKARREHARFEEGVPADPTVNMTEEEAEEWRANTEKYQDKFKKASSDERVSVEEPSFRMFQDPREAREVYFAGIKYYAKKKGLTYHDGGIFDDPYVEGHNARRILDKIHAQVWDEMDDYSDVPWESDYRFAKFKKASSPFPGKVVVQAFLPTLNSTMGRLRVTDEQAEIYMQSVAAQLMMQLEPNAAQRSALSRLKTICDEIYDLSNEEIRSLISDAARMVKVKVNFRSASKTSAKYPAEVVKSLKGQNPDDKFLFDGDETTLGQIIADNWDDDYGAMEEIDEILAMKKGQSLTIYGATGTTFKLKRLEKSGKKASRTDSLARINQKIARLINGV